MRRFTLILGLALALSTPAFAEHQIGPSCAGSAPADRSCELTVTLTADVVAVWVLVPDAGIMTYVIEGLNEIGAPTSQRCVIVAALYFEGTCQGPQPQMDAGDTVTLRVDVVGLGPWSVQLSYA